MANYAVTMIYPSGRTNFIGGLTRAEAVKTIIKSESYGIKCSLIRAKGNVEYRSPV